MTSLRLRRDLADQLGEVLAPHLPAEPWVPAPGRPDVLLRQALVDAVVAAGWRPAWPARALAWLLDTAARIGGEPR